MVPIVFSIIPPGIANISLPASYSDAINAHWTVVAEGWWFGWVKKNMAFAGQLLPQPQINELMKTAMKIS